MTHNRELDERCARAEGWVVDESAVSTVPLGKVWIHPDRDYSLDDCFPSYDQPANYERLIALAQEKGPRRYRECLCEVLEVSPYTYGEFDVFMEGTKLDKIANATPEQRLLAAVQTLEAVRAGGK